MPNSYDQQSQSELFEDAATATLDAEGTARPRDENTLTYALLQALTETARGQEQSLSILNRDSFAETASGEALTAIASDRYGIERRPEQAPTGTLTFSRATQPSSDIVVPEGTVAETVGTDPVQFETTEDGTITTSETSVTVNAQAVTAGDEGNVGANTVVAMPSPPTGVDEVTNPEPMGDPDFTLTDGTTPLERGLERESDAELRKRIFEATSFGGAASAGAIETAVGNIEDVISVSAVRNATSNDNTGSGGLPPYSTEVVVYDGATPEIVERLSDVMSIVDFERLYGGASGTKETYDVYSSLLNETVTGEITRPPKVSLDMTVDLIVTEDYAGDDVTRDTIVDYVGGFDTDNTRVTALGIGENIVKDKLEARITSVSGVRGITSLVIDATGDGNDDTTTDSDGLTVYDVGATEVAITNGADDSIIVNTTQT